MRQFVCEQGKGRKSKARRHKAIRQGNRAAILAALEQARLDRLEAEQEADEARIAYEDACYEDACYEASCWQDAEEDRMAQEWEAINDVLEARYYDGLPIRLGFLGLVVVE